MLKPIMYSMYTYIYMCVFVSGSELLHPQALHTHMARAHKGCQCHPLLSRHWSPSSFCVLGFKGQNMGRPQFWQSHAHVHGPPEGSARHPLFQRWPKVSQCILWQEHPTMGHRDWANNQNVYHRACSVCGKASPRRRQTECATCWNERQEDCSMGYEYWYDWFWPVAFSEVFSFFFGLWYWDCVHPSENRVQERSSKSMTSI